MDNTIGQTLELAPGMLVRIEGIEENVWASARIFNGRYGIIVEKQLTTWKVIVHKEIISISSKYLKPVT